MNDKEILKERIKYKYPMLHFTENNNARNEISFPDIPWHWHEDFEVFIMEKGQLIYKTLSKEILLEEGDIIFTNSRVIHSVLNVEPKKNIINGCQFFDNYFISGGEGNIIDTKYVIPLQRNSELDIIIFKPGDENYGKVKRLLDSNTKLWRTKEKYFEFELRRNVCDIWRIILESVENIDCELGIAPLVNKRLRKAITYIQKHYKEKITLEDIAENVHISIRECNRMFNKYLKISPINYLQSVRLQKATAMLTDQNKSIVEVALENGYTSSSYFGKIFKEHHNITPKEYRDRLLANKKS